MIREKDDRLEPRGEGGDDLKSRAQRDLSC